MSDDDHSDLEEVLEQVANVAMSGRCALVTGPDHEIITSLIGDLAMLMIEYGGELVRMDALQEHQETMLVQILVSSLGVTRSDLMASLSIRGETGNPILLLVDNAECLSSRTLEKLSVMLAETHGGLGVVLCGEPELEETVESSDITPALVYDVSGFEEVAEVADKGEGLRSGLPWRHLVAVAGLLLLVWMLWPAGNPQTETESRALVLPAPQLPADEVPAGTVNEASAAASETPVSVGSRAGEPDAVAPLEDAVADIEPLEPQSLPEPDPAPAPAPAPAPKVAPSPPPAPKPAPVQPATRPTAPALSSPELTGLAAELGYRQEDWLLALSADKWLLQLAMVSSEDSARAMLDRLGRDKGGYYRALRNGRQVYLLVAGPWSSRDTAVAARDKLPSSLRDLGPFPRSVADVHREISAQR